MFWDKPTMRHYYCSVCGIVGHEPEMIRTWKFRGGTAWIHESCIAGSKYERRKGAPDAEMDKDEGLRGAGQAEV